MSNESVCQVARSWVDVGFFHTLLVVKFMIFAASVRNILDTPPYAIYIERNKTNLNPLTPELSPSAQRCRDFLLGILIFKGLTARRLYKS
jgi:hypothetical protein